MTAVVNESSLKALLAYQKDSFDQAGYPELEIRMDRLIRLQKMIQKYDQQICETVAEDFGGRPQELSRMAEVYGTLEHIKGAIANLADWMKAEQRQAPFPANEAGATAEVRYMPKGVVGIIGPWNFPVHLVLGPLVCVLAAGNRAMIKPSEITGNTALLIADMVAEFFDETEVSVILGDSEVSRDFSKLPFDHLMFTGSTAVGRHVMQAAATNLTPVTLELGGKSPVVIDRDVDLAVVATRLIAGKLFNSGQVCVSPDYVLVAEELVRPLIDEMRKAFQIMFPCVADNPEYTAIISDNHFQRLQQLVDDAAERGVEVIEFNPAGEIFDQAESRKMLPKLILNPTDEVAIMQSEIFGPLLPLITYQNLNEAVDYIRNHDRPLAMYYFGHDESNKERLINHVVSGGMAINDVLAQVSCSDLPFGGVGNSGIGRYHGVDGFREFSHLKAVYSQTPVEEVAGFMRPPYSDAMRALLEQQIVEA